jgi:hypothetical protein
MRASIALTAWFIEACHWNAQFKIVYDILKG